MRPQVRTKNHSAEDLRSKNGGIGNFPVRSVVRLGSRTPTNECFPISYGKKPIIEVNTVEAVENSRDKLRMKACFAEAEVPQADWWVLRGNNTAQMRDINPKHTYGDNPENSIIMPDNLPYPILAKRICGFKGKGMIKLDNQGQLEEFIKSSNLNGYYFERYFSGSAEFRLHVTSEGCFMVWRKLRKSNTPEDKRWYFNSDHCNWVNEEHESFNKPSNWEEMVAQSINALEAVGLDIGSVDLRCQSPKKDNPKFIIVEINSAPALQSIGIEKYRTVLSDIISKKIANI